jgi:hypothetical protein
LIPRKSFTSLKGSNHASTGEVLGAWVCVPMPDDRDCKADWVICNECDGEEDEDDLCPMCTGSGGGYIRGTHDSSF